MILSVLVEGIKKYTNPREAKDAVISLSMPWGTPPTNLLFTRSAAKGWFIILSTFSSMKYFGL